MRAAKMGDPLDEDTQVGPHGAPRSARRAAPPGREELARARAACSAARSRTIPGPTTRRRPHRRAQGHAGVRRGAVRPGRRGHPASGTRKRPSQVANDSLFGLGGAVFTRDLARGRAHRRRADRERHACSSTTPSASDPRLPFGGIKESGYGRELSAYGIKEFVNIKTVYVAG